MLHHGALALPVVLLHSLALFMGVICSERSLKNLTSELRLQTEGLQSQTILLLKWVKAAEISLQAIFHR